MFTNIRSSESRINISRMFAAEKQFKDKRIIFS